MRVLFWKLTSNQQEELKRVVNSMNCIFQIYNEAFKSMYINTEKLFDICDKATKDNEEVILDKVEYIDLANLVEVSKEALKVFSISIQEVQAKMFEIEIKKWYPKKYKKLYSAWKHHINSSVRDINAAAYALERFEATKYTSKENRHALYLFYHSVNYISASEKYFREFYYLIDSN